MNNSLLNQYKKIYLETTPLEKEIDQSWENLQYRLPMQDKKRYVAHRYIFMATACLVLLFVGFMTTVQAARPGETLYPVKILQDKVVGSIIGKPEITIKKRAQDVIRSSQENPETMKKATDAYKETLQDAANDIQNTSQEKKKTLKKTLQEEEKKFENVESVHPRSQELLEKAIEQTRKTEGEVKGSATSSRSEEERSKKDEKNHEEQKHTVDQETSEEKQSSEHHQGKGK